MTTFCCLLRYDKQSAASDLTALKSAVHKRGSANWVMDDNKIFGGTNVIRYAHIIVAADARFDNHHALAQSLNISSNDSTTAELIAISYLKWGELCLKRFIGDFSFVIFDMNTNSLFGARDPIGVRPFYYVNSRNKFCAGSNIEIVNRFQDILEVNEQYVADFVSGIDIDKVSTPYKEVFRLPPGNFFYASAEKFIINRYWELSNTVYCRDDAADRFRSLLTQAVENRMGHRDDLGIMLSGGLDSSSIAMLAQKTMPNIPTYSMTFSDQRNWTDGRYIDSILNSGQFNPHSIISDNHDPLGDIDNIIKEQHGPFLAYNHSVSRQMYAYAKSKGTSVLLDGHGGDEAVSHGFGRLGELARDRMLGTLWREASGVAKMLGMSRWQILAPYLRSHRYFRGLSRRLAREKSGERHTDRNLRGDTWLLTSELRSAGQVIDRHQPSQFRYGESIEQSSHIANIDSPIMASGLELLDRASVASGVSARYPFLDVRLIEFCVSLPSELKLKHGYSRAILREGLKGILPEDVRLRTDKYDFRGQFARGLLNNAPYLHTLIEGECEELGGYMNLQAVGQCLKAAEHAGHEASPYDLMPIWRMVILARWITLLKNGQIFG